MNSGNHNTDKVQHQSHTIEIKLQGTIKLNYKDFLSTTEPSFAKRIHQKVETEDPWQTQATSDHFAIKDDEDRLK